MATVNIKCNADEINSGFFEGLIEYAAHRQVRCKYETRKAIVAKVESGAASSEREAERLLAEETGEKENTVHKRNQRAKQALGTKNQDVPTHGGARDSDGRPLKSEWVDHYNLYSEYLRCLCEKISEMSNMPEWKEHKNNILNEIHNVVYLINDK